MIKSLILLGVLTLTTTHTIYSNPIANLYDDFHSEVNTASIGSAFTKNGWSFLQNNQPFVFDKSLNDTSVIGFRNTSFESYNDEHLELGHVALDGVFDNLYKNSQKKELAFHPSFKTGASGDVIIRWTASKAYQSVQLNYEYRRGQKGNTGLAIRTVRNGVIGAFDFDDSEVGDKGVIGQIPYTILNSGDAIEIILYGGKSDNGAAGDQSFGNFIITEGSSKTFTKSNLASRPSQDAVDTPAATSALISVGGISLNLKQ